MKREFSRKVFAN